MSLTKNTARVYILLVISTIASTIGVIVLIRLESLNNSDFINIESEREDVQRMLKVDITGEVKKPGVYEFENGAIIDDAIEMAGGLTENADGEYLKSSLNMAEKLKDQQKIYIPAKMRQIPNEEGESVMGEQVNGDKININTASLSELDELPGIGPSYASKIIEGRPYSQIEDIKGVKGIGDVLFDKIRDLITV